MFLLSVKLNDLPLEMAEDVLMRAFLMLYSTDFDGDGDDDRCSVQSGKSRSSERRAYRVLSSVCYCWWQTLAGWPESPTPLWLKHKTKCLIEREYTLDSLSLKHFTAQRRQVKSILASEVVLQLIVSLSLSVYKPIYRSSCCVCCLFRLHVIYCVDWVLRWQFECKCLLERLSLNWPIGKVT